MALLKVLAGYKSCQLPVEEGSGIERYLLKMEFSNPSDEEDYTVYMMICPSHQVSHIENLIVETTTK